MLLMLIDSTITAASVRDDQVWLLVALPLIVVVLAVVFYALLQVRDQRRRRRPAKPKPQSNKPSRGLLDIEDDWFDDLGPEDAELVTPSRPRELTMAERMEIERFRLLEERARPKPVRQKVSSRNLGERIVQEIQAEMDRTGSARVRLTTVQFNLVSPNEEFHRALYQLSKAGLVKKFGSTKSANGAWLGLTERSRMLVEN